MNATFDIKVNITSDNVTTGINCDKMEDMDPTMVSTVMKMFVDLQNRIRTQMMKFYGVQKDNDGNAEEEQKEAPASQDTEAPQEDAEKTGE